MRSRRHHNNKGTKSIKNGSNENKLRRIAKRLKIKFKIGKEPKK